MSKRNEKKNIIISLFLLFFILQSTNAQGEENFSMPQDDTKIQNTIPNLKPHIEPQLKPQITPEEIQSAKPQLKPKGEYFNLANIVDNIMNNEAKPNYSQSENIADKKAKTRKDFLQITEKFNQGNASVAYDEYEKLLDEINTDTALLSIAKIFYEIGFFSLGNKALQKISYQTQYQDNIADLENCYLPKTNLSKEEEIYFAKIYSSIYFDNSAIESASELSSKKQKYQKNDFYNFILARAYLQSKKYSDSISFINKAISIAPNNLQYQIFKIDALTNAKKYQDALKIIQKLENQPNNINFVQKIKTQKEHILAQATKNDTAKKYHTLQKTFIEGNYEKVKKDSQNILNFDKDNSQIITMYAKSELALGNIERANTFFVNSYKIEKNNIETITGLGDIKFLHADYKNSVKMYKKAFKKDPENYETIIKLATAQREYAKSPKDLRKLEQKLDKMPKSAYLDYYKSALSIAQKNDVLKEDFLKRVLLINPMHENTLGALVELYLKNNNFTLAKNLISSTAITLEKNYYYYYLCGLYNQALNKKRDAIQFYKTSLNLNPSFEIANIKLLKLIPDNLDEEI